MNDYSTYALMDAALMVDAEDKPWMKSKRRPSWLISLYERAAWSVSPFIVDIDAAYRANRIDAVMGMVNLVPLHTHVSFIDTTLAADELADHLRQFSYVVTEREQELTLRIADCIVMPWLRDVMSHAQWAAIHKPIHRWKIHSREGRLVVLPRPTEVEPIVPPLRFTAQQIADLEKAHEPEQLMSNLRVMRSGHRWAETPQLEIQIAEQTLKVWKDSGRTDSSTLLIFARGVFDTKGQLLNSPTLARLLAHDDSALVQRGINHAVESQRWGSI